MRSEEKAGHKEELADKTRHGSAHYDYSQGIGVTRTALWEMRSFWWRLEGPELREIPWGTVVEKLTAEHQRIRETVRRISGEVRAPFLP